MVTMRWNEIPASHMPSTKPAPRKSLPSTLGTPRVLRSATIPTPSPITPQRQRVVSLKASSMTSSPLKASPPSVRSPQSRHFAASPATASTRTASASVSSRMAPSIGTTAATSVHSLKPVSVAPEKTVPRLVSDLSRIPQIIEIRRIPEVERGAFERTSGRLVASTRFAARAGSERKIYISTGTTTNKLGGAWNESGAIWGLDTPAKRPTCLAVDEEKIIVSPA